MRPSPLALAALALAAAARAAIAVEPAAVRPVYHIHASLSREPPQVAGKVEVELTNTSAGTLEDVVLLLFPNRFSVPDDGVNDFNRPYVYPEQDFDPGQMVIGAALDGDRPARTAPVPRPGLPLGSVAHMHIAPLSPGETRMLTFEFRTRVPHRFGSFGEFEGQLTLVGGWHPQLAPLAADGSWVMDGRPAAADFDVRLEAPADTEVVLGDHFFPAGAPMETTVPARHYLSLIASAGFVRSEIDAAGGQIVLLHRPERRSSRLSFEAPISQILLSTLRDVVELRPDPVPAPAQALVVVEAPLRLELTAAGEGAAIVSDRALRINKVLRPFHDLQIAAAVYAELLRPELARREPATDYWWVSEGASRLMAKRFFDRTRSGTRSVRDWIEKFNIFAIVDRFENEPKIPFVGTFFEGARFADPLRSSFPTFNGEPPPGRATMVKLRELIGPEEFDRELDRCLAGAAPFRECMAGTLGDHHLDELLALWLAPLPDVNYRIDHTAFNTTDVDGRRRSSITVRRESSRPYTEPVKVRLRAFGEPDADLVWKSGGEVARMSRPTEGHVYQAVIDPEHQLVETRRDDNASPPTPQIVLDTADVEVSSTEFSFSALAVGRARYDYRKDIAVAGFYTNRGGGFTAGGRYHFGPPIDATTYPHNVYAFYELEALDGDFKEHAPNAVRTDGLLASLGIRYGYTNLYAYDDPSHQRDLGLYFDWHDKALGSDFEYLDWGGVVTLTQPLHGNRTVGALQISNGFSQPIDGSRVPNQGLYSLGGSRSIRGIDAEDDLGENILTVRTELRQDIYPELDLNLLDVMVLRRTQVRAFVDSGRVSDDVGSIYRVDRFAAGIGLGVEAFYEFLGFFPASAYIEVATRVDEPSKSDDVQVLFGTRQAF